MPARQTQPDRSEPARQDRPSGTASPRSAGSLFRLNATTTARPNRRWAGTRSVPAERPQGRRPALSVDRSSPAGNFQRSPPPPAKASSCSSSPARPWSHTEPASTGQQPKTPTPSPRRLVPSERLQHRSVDPLIRRSRRTTSKHSGDADNSNRCASTTHRPDIAPSRSIEAINRLVPAERQPTDPLVQARRVWAVFDSPHACLSTLGGRTNEPTSQPRHATNV